MNHQQPDPYTQIDGLPASQMRDVLMQLAIAFPAAFEAALRQTQFLAEAAASNGNPYGSFPEAKHGHFDAPSATEVARGVPHLPQHVGNNPRCTFCGQFHEAPVRGPLPTAAEVPAARCPECARDIATEQHQIGCPLTEDPHPDGEPTAREIAAGFTLACRVPHGPDSRCFDCATDDELAAAIPPAPTAVADASRLAGHMPEGAQ